MSSSSSPSSEAGPSRRLTPLVALQSQAASRTNPTLPPRPPPTPTPTRTPSSFFPTPALDHAFGGITAGAVATVCMNPLDLIKTQFQVDTSPGGRAAAAASSSTTTRLPAHTPSRWRWILTGGQISRDMTSALRSIVRKEGWTGLYRGLSPNVVGNSSSWGLYFLFYTMIKERMAGGGAGEGTPPPPHRALSPGQHLLAASESGAITALITNPIWVVKTRMFTRSGSGSTGNDDYATIRGSLAHIYRTEGVRGLYRGAGLALFGVSNGAIQFMAYEQLKRYRSDVAVRRRSGMATTTTTTTTTATSSEVQLPNHEYVIISGSAKLLAIILTYPYQVIRSRIQNHATQDLYQSSVRRCVRLTYSGEGLSGFYKGLSANLVRILPATCVTFVVYENVAWALKGAAAARVGREEVDTRG